MRLGKVKLGIATLAALATLSLATGAKADSKPTQESITTQDSTSIDSKVKGEETKKEENEEENLYHEEKKFSHEPQKIKLNNKTWTFSFTGIKTYNPSKDGINRSTLMQPYLGFNHSWKKEMINSPDSEKFPLTFFGKEKLEMFSPLLILKDRTGCDAIARGSLELGTNLAKLKGISIKPFYRLKLGIDAEGIPDHNTMKNLLGIKIDNPKQHWQIGIEGFNERYTGLKDKRVEPVEDEEAVKKRINSTGSEAYFGVWHMWFKQPIKSPDKERYPLIFFGGEYARLSYQYEPSEKDSLVASGNIETGVMLVKFKDTLVEPFYNLSLSGHLENLSNNYAIQNSLGARLKGKEWWIDLRGTNTYKIGNSITLTFTAWNIW